MAARKQKLSDSLRLQQLFRDVEDEETWIREKEPIASSTNRGEAENQFGCSRITLNIKSVLNHALFLFLCQVKI